MLKLMVVEDEQIEREGLIALVRQRFSDRLQVCGVADSGPLAVERAVALKPDIILFDIQIPGFDGLEAAQILRERGITTEIVIATAYSRFEYARRALQLGAVDYLIKPYSIRTLETTLNRTIERIVERDPHRGAEKGPPASSQSPPSQLVAKVQAFIDEHFSRDLTLDEIAGHCAISRYHLSRAFRRAHGVGIKETLTLRRVEHARSLLSSGCSVAEAAFACGFNDANYFCRVFKKSTGYSPGQIRKRN